MKQSQLFSKTRKEAPADEAAKNAKLLIRAGYIHKEMAGVYSYLPLGLRVLTKIRSIVAKEMEKLGSGEIIMSAIQAKEIWQLTERWSDDKVDVWFKSALKSGNEIGFGWSHEEPITSMMKGHISSYKDLPRYVHQFQTKLRNEARAKSGIMRCREFLMKDMYSYSRDEKEHTDFYNKTIDAYLSVFKIVGLGKSTFVTSASGGFFTDKFSHEFQTLCDAGEDEIYVHKDGTQALNSEIFTDETLSKLNAKREDFELKKAAEVGNIFTFGTKKCEQLGLSFIDQDGTKKPVFLGSYGIGISRLMGVVAEVFSDQNGLVWPKEIAPFNVHLIEINPKADPKVRAEAERIYKLLSAKGVEVLWDDREATAGQKFADSDLMGIPMRYVVSAKTIEAKSVEQKERATGKIEMLPISSI